MQLVSPAENIAKFLAYAREKLKPYHVFVSADVFGLVTSVEKGDMGIGQIWEPIAAQVDYICPMVYPSHYGPRVYGLPNPDAAPYETVFTGLTYGVKRLEKAGSKAIIRPWLQDFTLGVHYGPKEVRAQIKAVYDAGLSEWILWNPANIYTVDALEKE